MVMLVPAFDVSKDQPLKNYLIMAGFVSSAERWAEFDQAWRDRLNRDGLAHFHMVDFAHSVKEFDGWRDQRHRRESLMNDLLAIITEHAYQKFACVMEVAAYSCLSDNARASFATTPIAAAGIFTAGLVYAWRDREGYRERRHEFVFEDGDDDKESLRRAIKEVNGVEPIFRPKKDIPEKGILAFTPLQAADLLAYELKKVTDEIGRILPDDFRFRFPLQQLEKIGGEPRLFNSSSIPAAEMLIRTNHYFKQNPLGS